MQAAREDIKRTLDATGGVGKTTERTLAKGLGALTVRMLTEVASERLTPTAVRNVLQAVRWADEGVTNSQGEPIVERGDLSPWDLFLKFNGMTPDEVSAQYDMNRMVKNYEQRLVKERARLLTAYWFAYLDGTPADRRKVMEKIGRYNAGRPAKPIDVETLRRSVKTRMRYRGEAISGVNLDPDYRYLVDRAQVAM